MNPQETVVAPAPSPVTGALEGPGALVKFGWNTFTKHWKSLAPIIIFPSIIVYIIQLLMSTANPIAGIIAFILMICVVIVSIASVPAAAQAVHNLSTNPGTPISFKGQYKFGFSVFWSALLLFIIAGLVQIGAFTLLFIPGIIVSVFVCTHVYAFTVDGKRGFSALVESFNLVRGRWWGVFGRVIVGGLVAAAIVLICSGLLYLIAYVSGISMRPAIGETMSTGAWVISTIIGIIQGIISGTFTLGYTYRLYSSLKSTRSPEAASPFKGWLIAFLCVGILSPIAIIGLLSSVVFMSLNSARIQADNMRNNSNTIMADIQRQIDAENQKMIQQNMPGSSTQ